MPLFGKEGEGEIFQVDNNLLLKAYERIMFSSVLRSYFLISITYTLRFLPQFLISVILACPESFLRFRKYQKDSRQAGMTLETNIQFLTPCGLCRRVLHVVIFFGSVIAQLDWAIQKKGTGLSGRAG